MERKEKNPFFRMAEKLLFDPSLTCAACGAELFGEEPFCPHCLKTLPFNSGSVCSKCGRKTGGDYPVCLECKARMPVYDRARSVFSYEGEVVRLIKKLKTGGKYLGKIFGECMAKIAEKEFSACDFAVFVPMTEKAEKKRGYNQSRLLAEEVCAAAGIPLEGEVLVKTRETGEQKWLSKKERAHNLAGSFRVHERKKCRDKRILVIDDVMTTGATANAIASSLRAAGAKEVCLLTAASVPLGENQVK